MKTLRSIMLSIGVAALLGASGLHAQTQANIPFAFSAQNTTLPAGQYTMAKITGARTLLVVRNVETKQALMVLAPSGTTEIKGSADKNVVLFHRIGDRYFLAEVKSAGLAAHVIPSKLERELTAEGSGPVAAVIIPALGVR